LSGMFLFARGCRPLAFPSMLGQPAKADLPKDAVARETTKRRAQWDAVKLAVLHATFGLDLQQARALEHAKVLRDRGEAHLVRLGEFTDRRVPAGQSLDDGPPNGMGQGREDRVQVDRCFGSGNHLVK